MGIAAGLQTISDENLRRVLADPPRVWSVLAPDDPDALAEARARRAPRRGLLAWLLGRPAPTPAPHDDTPLRTVDGEGAFCDLDKAWHGIHYLLTGGDDAARPPLDFLVQGGEVLEDAGEYGARAFTAAQAAAIAAALAPIDEPALRARFDPADMKRRKIYPDIWDRDPADDDALGYCVDYFMQLKPFVAEAARRGLGLIVSMS